MVAALAEQLKNRKYAELLISQYFTTPITIETSEVFGPEATAFFTLHKLRHYPRSQIIGTRCHMAAWCSKLLWWCNGPTQRSRVHGTVTHTHSHMLIQLDYFWLRACSCIH